MLKSTNTNERNHKNYTQKTAFKTSIIKIKEQNFQYFIPILDALSRIEKEKKYFFCGIETFVPFMLWGFLVKLNFSKLGLILIHKEKITLNNSCLIWISLNNYNLRTWKIKREWASLSKLFKYCCYSNKNIDDLLLPLNIFWYLLTWIFKITKGT